MNQYMLETNQLESSFAKKILLDTEFGMSQKFVLAAERAYIEIQGIP